MESWSSFDEVVDFAIKGEEEAEQFYTEMAAKAKDAWMRTTFEGFAREERGHKAKLQSIKAGGATKPSDKKVQDLKIAEYVVDIVPGEDISYQDALIVAMKSEKAAFKLYSDLARTTHDDRLRETFLALAQEEAKHKLRFEVEYDDNVLTEN